MATDRDDIERLVMHFGPSVGAAAQCAYEAVIGRKMASGEFYQIKGACVEAIAAGKLCKEDNG